MTTPLKTRFKKALTLSNTEEIDLSRLSAMINLVIPEGDRTTLWKDFKTTDFSTSATITALNLLVFAYCKGTFLTELERDVAYILCLKQLIELNNKELEIYFEWYTRIPTDEIVIKV